MTVNKIDQNVPEHVRYCHLSSAQLHQQKDNNTIGGLTYPKMSSKPMNMWSAVVGDDGASPAPVPALELKVLPDPPPSLGDCPHVNVSLFGLLTSPRPAPPLLEDCLSIVWLIWFHIDHEQSTKIMGAEGGGGYLSLCRKICPKTIFKPQI